MMNPYLKGLRSIFENDGRFKFDLSQQSNDEGDRFVVFELSYAVDKRTARVNKMYWLWQIQSWTEPMGEREGKAVRDAIIRLAHGED